MAAKSSTPKPRKPYKEFPLFPHQNGQWAKKIRGKLWYFGKWDDPEGALEHYLDDVDHIQAGRDPRRTGVVEVSAEAITVADMFNLFLATLDTRCQAGEISARHFSDNKRSCAVALKHFGRRVLASTLRAADFSELKKAFPGEWGPVKVGTEVQRIRSAFRWAAEAEVIPGVPNFGPDFKKPPRAVARRERNDRQAKHGKLSFEAAELQSLLDTATGWLKACILLGINAGFGAADCGRLRAINVDFETGWYDLPRRKTAIPRRFFVWSETREAIQEAMQCRPLLEDQDDEDLCFLTSHGRPVWWESSSGAKSDNVGKSFQKLCRKLGISRPGRSFYSLRRTYETIAGESKDQIAVNYAMGHSDDSMAAVYRQGISDERLIDVAQFVRQWLWSRKCPSCEAMQFSVSPVSKCEACFK